ncbi:uncharacterized protein LOC132613034 [Lycium barbarum]|uniref:uncharacterized protein LOC132613034 n=1 Tax=Lycium barbarum TaxID=112863 RepID=UPI00293F6E76|nr:uncharacterized protein LOC132613034 [Lycium barbarum]
MLLSEFDIQYVAPKTVKGQALADLPAGSPVDDNPVPVWTYFSDEEIMKIEDEESEYELGWKVYFDGVVNFKRSGIGAVLVSDSGKYYLVATKLSFSCTNNMAEYEACILGLRLALDMDVKELQQIRPKMPQVSDSWRIDKEIAPKRKYNKKNTATSQRATVDASTEGGTQAQAGATANVAATPPNTSDADVRGAIQLLTQILANQAQRQETDPSSGASSG